MKLDEIEKALLSMEKENVMIEERGGDVILSSMVGHLSDVQESNFPNVIIAFLDANLHIQPASFGILVEENDVAIKATVLLDHEADLKSLKKSVEALDLAIRTATSIMDHASNVAVS